MSEQFPAEQIKEAMTMVGKTLGDMLLTMQLANIMSLLMNEKDDLARLRLLEIDPAVRGHARDVAVQLYELIDEMDDEENSKDSQEGQA